MSDLAKPVDDFSPMITERNAPALRNLTESYRKSN